MKREEEYWMQVRQDIEDEPKSKIEEIYDKYADKSYHNCSYKDWIEAVIVVGNILNLDTTEVGTDGFWSRELYQSHCTAGNYWDTEEDI